MPLAFLPGRRSARSVFVLRRRSAWLAGCLGLGASRGTLSRFFTRGRRVAIYRRNDRGREHGGACPAARPNTPSSRSAVRQRGAIYPRFSKCESHGMRARCVCVRACMHACVRATRRDATPAHSLPITMGAFADATRRYGQPSDDPTRLTCLLAIGRSP